MTVRDTALKYNKAARAGQCPEAYSLMQELDSMSSMSTHFNLHYIFYLFPPIILSIDYIDPNTGAVVESVHVEDKPGFIDAIMNKENW